MLEQLLSNYIGNAGAANARGEYAAAAEWCQRSLQLAPDLPEAWYHLGNAFGGMGRKPEAVDALEKARVRTLNSADAQNSIGLQLTELGAYLKAEQCLNQALALAPDYAFAHSNLGKLRSNQRRLDDAETAFRKAIALNPDLAPAYVNLGGVLSDQKNYGAAEAACRKATELAPDSAEAWLNLGVALNGLKQHEAAESSYAKALALAPNLSDVWVNLGIALDEMKRYEAAADCYKRGIELNANAEFVFGSLLHAKMKICDWRSLANDLPKFFQDIEAGRKVAIPFGMLGFTADLSLQCKAATLWVKDKGLDSATASSIPKHQRRDKIRVGYFSADFHDHATMRLMAELFEKHNRSRFELYAFSFGPDRKDAMRDRALATFDKFLDVRLQSDKAVVQLSRDLEIDIAIDLSGFTLGSRPDIFSLRAAPVQVNYLVYPATMGADFMDYLIADKTVIPEESRRQYSENIVYLPNSYQPNDSKRLIADKVPSREEAGLPAIGFVFCCFNNSFKITPEVFDCWMRILKAVEGSVLWLLEDNPKAAINLHKEALQRGVDPKRLIFAKRLPSADHLARHRLADLFLDTLPYNAHTTASDALWAGLPVLTCMSESFASRVAASLLHTVGLTELITLNMTDYEASAIELATVPRRLAQIREKLARNRLTTPLFDTPLFVSHIEAAYTAMYERYQSDLPPACIYVQQ